MMPALMGGALPGLAPTTATYPADTFFDDLSRQMALSQASRRLSRGSNGQRTGTAMRVVKPTSANNSPRSSSSVQARRRTLMNDGNLARRRQQVMDHVQMPEYNSQQQPRPSRPLSWHPSTFQQQQHKLPVQQHEAQYPFPSTSSAYHDNDSYSAYSQFPPTPAAYSCNTSPTAHFSPLSLPFGAYGGSSYLPVEGWNVPQQVPPAYVTSSDHYAEPFPALPTTLPDLTPSSTSTSWNSYPMNGFTSTSPPTPETLPQAQQPQPIVANEDSIPYQPLDEPEEEGEILVGMGLYDAPEKYDNDARSGMSSLLGATYRPREGTGKGLKLEESWQPPEESDDDDEDQEDADGEDSD
ncbi:hypothetical protein CkaCkLH20_01408 [Colletotrichum karsti]|uniref:Uncharacterized protein n=1 Tax=Colletotrichum karsti TaxID=1095194 RepID=A0A9P6ICW1_9PEZI|nr:uncharacterized protein CkaCkLH20_01408 [Colletotrichum karsti]KAF9881258.1 hypothetical protein CkaCkLH20_01408 [Colletotrichum karsti]